jgi:hypothetical protein
MRKAYNSEFCIENNNLLGINLGADFTSEHEWGIDGIKRSFSLTTDDTVFGIERRKINIVPENLIYRDVVLNNKTYHLIILLDSWDYSKKYFEVESKEWIPRDLKPFGSEELVCAWDERTFGILVSDKYEKELKAIYQAFINKDIAIGVAPSGAFQNGGLRFTIVSKLPKSIIEKIHNNDTDAVLLKNIAEETGIYELLKKAGKKFYSLRPKWKNENKKEVIFWLNPQDQHLYNYGWYTVQDLKEWARNKGKIIIKKKGMK